MNNQNKSQVRLINASAFLLVGIICLIAGILIAQRCKGRQFASSLNAHTACAEAAAADDCCPPEEGQNAEHEHDEHKHAEGVVSLQYSAIRDFGIETTQAAAGKIAVHTSLPAEITLNGDKQAHVVPRIGGVVISVKKTLGDKVHAGDILAVIQSRQLADYKAAYLAAKEKTGLNDTIFQREKRLWEKKVTAEQDYLNAKKELADAQIELRSAKQKLLALGFSEQYLQNLNNAPEESYIVYEIAAPVDGTIIEKHVTAGEVLTEDSEICVIADLSNVWVNVSIAQKDLSIIKQGQKAIVKTDYAQGEGTVTYVSSVVNENTRTALGRIVLSNDTGQWRPGTFATADIFVEEFDCDIAVPMDSIVSIEAESMIFVKCQGGYEAKPVQLGRANNQYAEVTSGLKPGEEYVVKGAFTIKSEMTKSTQDPCGGH